VTHAPSDSCPWASDETRKTKQKTRKIQITSRQNEEGEEEEDGDDDDDDDDNNNKTTIQASH
jgi:hypothetical protein